VFRGTVPPVAVYGVEPEFTKVRTRFPEEFTLKYQSVVLEDVLGVLMKIIELDALY
jgi:hypothetical protein